MVSPNTIKKQRKLEILMSLSSRRLQTLLFFSTLTEDDIVIARIALREPLLIRDMCLGMSKHLLAKEHMFATVKHSFIRRHFGIPHGKTVQPTSMFSETWVRKVARISEIRKEDLFEYLFYLGIMPFRFMQSVEHDDWDNVFKLHIQKIGRAHV